MPKITFKPSGMIVTDILADGRVIAMLRKDGRAWRLHVKGDLTGIELSKSATLSRAAAIEILGRNP